MRYWYYAYHPKNIPIVFPIRNRKVIKSVKDMLKIHSFTHSFLSCIWWCLSLLIPILETNLG